MSSLSIRDLASQLIKSKAIRGGVKAVADTVTTSPFQAFAKKIAPTIGKALTAPPSPELQQTFSGALEGTGFKSTPESRQQLSKALAIGSTSAVGLAEPLKVFKGLKGLSTKLLEKFKGMPEEITPQQFNEVINKALKGGIKRADSDIVNRAVAEQIGGVDKALSGEVRTQKINLPKVAAKVEEQLVPLTPTPVKSPRYSNVGADFIGDGKYGEMIYQSPIKTSAGDVHFQAGRGSSMSAAKANQDSFPNYFSHVRYEDMADGKTRKILETQSDLMQKENFAAESSRTSRTAKDMAEGKLLVAERNKELSKLQPYSSNDPLAHLRTFREEVKRAAKDGKDTILIPSGETAMKIEGLGQDNKWFVAEGQPLIRVGGLDVDNPLTPNLLRQGLEVSQGEGRWIITDILGDGKFKAVPKDIYSRYLDKNIAKNAPKETRDAVLERAKETFDISGKVDTKHFVYKLNEEAIPKEARKMGLEVVGKVKEGQGEYWKIKIGKERARLPVEAFGALPFLANKRREEEKKNRPPEKLRRLIK